MSTAVVGTEAVEGAAVVVGALVGVEGAVLVAVVAVVVVAAEAAAVAVVVAAEVEVEDSRTLGAPQADRLRCLGSSPTSMPSCLQWRRQLPECTTRPRPPESSLDSTTPRRTALP